MKEIEREAYRLKGETIRTIYFGGGTPSLLTLEELNQIMAGLNQQFSVSDDAEITLEANPDDITAEMLAGWKQAGVNRLSIGVQSFREQDLQWMNRAHTAGEALNCIKLAQEAGFTNLTIDLIYGVPGLSDSDWETNVRKAIELEIPHLSCYALTVEPKTALDHMIRAHKVSDIDPDQQSRQFLLLMDWLAGAGYEHYEISNFARPGMRSRHNSAYWQGVHYIGFGPGAHSFDGKHRRWNVSNNAVYIKAMENGGAVSEEETLSFENRYNEYVMTALRTMEGINLHQVRHNYGDEYAGQLLSGAEKHNIAEKLLTISENSIRLTNEGKLFADGIAASLFL